MASLHENYIYICNLWGNAHLPDVYANLPLRTESGWVVNEDGTYSLDWNDPTRQQQIGQNMLSLVNGCKCKTGCSSSRCGCRKKSVFCGPGCYCSNCKNVPTSSQRPVDTEDSRDEVLTSDTETSESDEIETDIVTDNSFMLLDDII